MNVHDLEISLRPRKGWEAVDLGIHLARRYYRDLLKIGFQGFLPVWTILIILLWKWPQVSIFIIWWLKPIYDRFYLHYYSRRIFGNEVTVKEVLKKAPHFLFKRSLIMLTWRRLSPWRSMTLPIADLENLKGKRFSQRAETVKRIGGGHAATTTLTFHGFEGITLMGVFIFLLMFIPQFSFEGVQQSLMIYSENTGLQLISMRISTIIYALIYLFLEPFYVGAGFALYLNSRCEQEAWDIELRLKEFASRIGKSVLKVASTLVLAGLLLGTSTAPASAKVSALTSEQVQEQVEEVYESEDFTIHTKVEQVPVLDENNWFFDFLDWIFSGDNSSAVRGGGFLEPFLKLLAIIVITVVVIALLFVLAKILAERRGDLSPQKTLKKDRPKTVLGMEITEESLPDDLLSEARAAWSAGDFKRALSYLYRGALSKIVIEHDAEIESSDTEYECLDASKKVLSTDRARYFSILTRHWITVAYSKQLVSDGDFNELCEQWAFREQ